jgi:hypothetical protein
MACEYKRETTARAAATKIFALLTDPCRYAQYDALLAALAALV